MKRYKRQENGTKSKQKTCRKSDKMISVKKLCLRLIPFLAAFFVMSSVSPVFGWHHKTHIAIAKAAGYKRWYNAAAADVTKLKAGNLENYNHIFRNTDNMEVTPAMVLEQESRYNDPDDKEGHLYGAILASLRQYEETGNKYHLDFCVHYAGDLSQPLHNTPNDDFNRRNHFKSDGAVDHEVLNNIGEIEKNMYPIDLRERYFVKDLSREIARIAELSRKLSYRLRQENRNLTREEAYIQLGHSASLFRAILMHLGETR
jgi:hypothetical protein